MKGRIKHIGLLAIGAVAGILVSLGISAVAQREARTPLPLAELRQFSDVFGAIKSNYVEPVEDKKLITEAISGMLTGGPILLFWLSSSRLRMAGRGCSSWKSRSRRTARPTNHT